MSRSEILDLIDDRWMVEDPSIDEYAFLFRWIQERHRSQFEKAFQHTDPSQYEAFVGYLGEINDQRTRAEEILYWLYRDSELRQQGQTLPDLIEEGEEEE